jgi:hypothetical protein
MATLTNNRPILLELDEKSWSDQLDRLESWLDHLRMAQGSYRQLLEDTVEKIEEPHLHQYLSDILARARQHEGKIVDLYTLIGRSPSKTMQWVGDLSGKLQGVLGDLLVPSGGVTGPWQDLHQVFMFNYNSMSAFAVAEQLGLALGIGEFPDVTFPIVAEKSADQLLLQEFALELCSLSILYRQPL